MPTAPILTPSSGPFTELNEVSSTNIYAADQVQANMAGHGSAFFAHRQTSGKGRRGKNWYSPAGENVLLSVVLDMKFQPVTQQFPLGMAMALAGFDLFSRYAPEKTSIKWPNDIFWGDRKAGGILIDNIIGAPGTSEISPVSGSSSWKWAIAGIGMNINQQDFPAELSKAGSLKLATGISYDVPALARELHALVLARYEQLKQGETGLLCDEYNRHLYLRQQSVRLKKDSAVFSCRVESVNASGELLVSGAVRDRFSFGEVEWIID